MPDVISTEINELNIRYKYKINKRITGLKSLNTILFFEEYKNMKHKPSKTVLIDKKLDPIIIEIGKTENNIVGTFIFMFSISFI